MTTAALDVDAIVFDVLGTLVDEQTGLSAALHQHLPADLTGATDVGSLVQAWVDRVGVAQADVVANRRPYLTSATLNHEVATAVLAAAGSHDPLLVPQVATAAGRPPAWPDSAAGLERLGDRYPVVALSNACRSDLLQLNAHAGLRFHLALSAESVRTYKPSPAVYELAVAASGLPAHRLLMVAAHAWDLRGARAVGMRTAYVARPVGDPPRDGECFDVHADDLEDLAAQLPVHRSRT